MEKQSQNIAKVALLLVGVLTSAFGTLGVLLLANNADDLATYLLTAVSGLVMTISSFFAASSVKQLIAVLASLIAIGLPTLACSTDLGNNASIGYIFAIVIAGILTIGEAIVWASVGAAAGYSLSLTIYIINKPNGITTKLWGDIGTVYFCIGLVGILMLYFTRLLQRQAQSERSQKERAEYALAQLAERQAIERKVEESLVEQMGKLKPVAAKLVRLVSEQVNSNHEVTAAVSELSQAATQIAAEAGRLAGEADIALDVARTSREATSDSHTATMQIRMQVQQIVERTVALNQSIQRIGDVTTTVTNIAAHTHLVALNASIEAVGAGQAGERFQTVAGEVKKLAQMSQEEASHIRRLLEEVQRANAASVMATEQGLKDADKGSAQSRAAAEANLEVIEIVGGTAIRTATITLATEQQRSASEQVVETIQQMVADMERVRDVASTIDAAFQAMASMSIQLHQLINTPPDMSNPEQDENNTVGNSLALASQVIGA